MIAPTFKETLTPGQAQARLRQLGASYIRAKSQPNRQVYWVRSRDLWILVSPAGNTVVLGYYQMEKCPCDD